MTAKRRPAPRKTNGTPAPQHRPDAGPQPGVMQVTIGVVQQPTRVARNQNLTLQPPADPATPFLLVLGPEGIWHGVMLEPGADWELRRKDAQPTPGIWRPGMPT